MLDNPSVNVVVGFLEMVMIRMKSADFRNVMYVCLVGLIGMESDWCYKSNFALLSNSYGLFLVCVPQQKFGKLKPLCRPSLSGSSWQTGDKFITKCKNVFLSCVQVSKLLTWEKRVGIVTVELVIIVLSYFT